MTGNKTRNDNKAKTQTQNLNRILKSYPVKTFEPIKKQLRDAIRSAKSKSPTDTHKEDEKFRGIM